MSYDDVDELEKRLGSVPDLEEKAPELCGRCSARPAAAGGDECTPCGRDSDGITSFARAERARARKRAWWAEHGRAWRAARRAAA